MNFYRQADEERQQVADLRVEYVNLRQALKRGMRRRLTLKHKRIHGRMIEILCILGEFGEDIRPLILGVDDGGG